MSDPDLLAKISADRALASLVVFPHRHPQREAPMHLEISDLMASRDEFIVLEAFREAGKTTKAEEHLILAGCFRNFNYGLLIGETYEKACQRLGAIDHELKTNEILRELFGNPLEKRSIENKIWFASGAYLQAFGWEQELQSFKYQTYRPDFAFLDDVENQERVRDKAAVNASMDKLFHDLRPAMDKERRKIVVSQTRRAEDCMVTRLAANRDWLYRGYPIADRDPDDPQAVAIWPARYPIEWVRKEKASYQHAGKLSAFLQAYMLQTVNPEAKPFKEEMFGAMDVSPWHWMPRYVIYDPSRSTREKRERNRTSDLQASDRTGKVVVSRMGSKILVHESGGFYWRPDELLGDLFNANESHHPARIGVEKTSLDEWLLQPVRIEMLRRGETLPLKALNAPQDRSKEDFIMGLQPFAIAKDIVLVGGKHAHPQLVAEWVNFPQGPRDVLNALAYSLRMFAGLPVYEDFSGANIADAPEPAVGEEIFVAFQASTSEIAAVAVVRELRRLAVAADFVSTGSISESAKTAVFDLRTRFPRARWQVWVPADTYDQGQRIPLVAALRAEKLTPMRAEHVQVSRGTLSTRLRTAFRNSRMLTVDKRAIHTLNALAAGYAFSAEKGDRHSAEPESGASRLIAEALECMIAVLDAQPEQGADGLPKGAHVAYNPSGHRYITANPRAR